MELIKRATTIAGALLLVLGCFLPVLNTMGNRSGLLDPIPAKIPDIPENALQYCAAIIMGIAVISVVLALMRRTKFLWISGLVAGSFLVCVHGAMQMQIDQMKEDTNQQLESLFGGMFKSVAQSLFDKVEIAGIGWYVIGAGSLLLIFSSLLKTNNTNETNK